MLRYVGDGTQVPGIPPRDLNDEEAAQWGSMIAEVDAARAAAGMGALYAPDNGRPTTDDEGPVLPDDASLLTASRRRGRKVADEEPG